MPEAGFGTKLNLPGNEGKFVKLAAKGDKIRFRIASTPHYQTKHFLPDNSVVLCGKYNSDDKEAPCEYCDKYLLAVDQKNKKDERQYRPVTNFYYPIVNMDLDKAQVFQFSAKSIHYIIAGYADKGVDVFGCTWYVERTEEKGNYYQVLRLDDKPLTKEQKEALETAKAFKLESKLSSSVVLESEEESVPSEE